MVIREHRYTTFTLNYCHPIHQQACWRLLALQSRGLGFKSDPLLLCTNANSACHPSGVG